VIDLRSLVPLDREAIIDSVRKTHRLVVVDEDYRSFGMTGEVITTVVEGAFDYLDAPPLRIAVPDVPIPYSRPLEQFVLPDADKIVAGVEAVMAG
jgi:pyruvate dehydrogenase E1 component beta subunit